MKKGHRYSSDFTNKNIMDNFMPMNQEIDKYQFPEKNVIYQN